MAPVAPLSLDFTATGTNLVSFPENSFVPDFIGFSLEMYGTKPVLDGTDPAPGPQAFATASSVKDQLLFNLKDFTGSSPQFRMGGDSSDNWAFKDLQLTKQVFDRFAKWADDKFPDMRVTIGVPLKLNNTKLAVDVAKVALHSFTMHSETLKNNLLKYLELGNEPEAYNITGSIYAENYKRIANEIYSEPEISRLLADYVPGKVMVAGTYMNYDGDAWPFSMDTLYKNPSLEPLLGSISQHWYSAIGHGQTNVKDILLPNATDKLVNFLQTQQPKIRQAQEKGITYKFGEVGAFSSGSINAGYNAGSAIWMVEMLLLTTSGGVESVFNHHCPAGGCSYSSIGFTAKGEFYAKTNYYGQYFVAEMVSKLGLAQGSKVTIDNIQRLTDNILVYHLSSELKQAVIVVDKSYCADKASCVNSKQIKIVMPQSCKNPERRYIATKYSDAPQTDPDFLSYTGAIVDNNTGKMNALENEKFQVSCKDTLCSIETPGDSSAFGFVC